MLHYSKELLKFIKVINAYRLYIFISYHKSKVLKIQHEQKNLFLIIKIVLLSVLSVFAHHNNS
jgi:hypothetical protein